MTDEVEDAPVEVSSGTPAGGSDQASSVSYDGLHRFEQAVEELETIARVLKAIERRSKFRIV